MYKTAKMRSSHQRSFMKKGVLRNFTKLTGKHLCQSLKSEICNFIKKETLAQVFSCEILQNTFFTEHFWVTAFVK